MQAKTETPVPTKETAVGSDRVRLRCPLLTGASNATMDGALKVIKCPWWVVVVMSGDAGTGGTP